MFLTAFFSHRWEENTVKSGLSNFFRFYTTTCKTVLVGRVNCEILILILSQYRHDWQIYRRMYLIFKVVVGERKENQMNIIPTWVIFKKIAWNNSSAVDAVAAVKALLTSTSNSARVASDVLATESSTLRSTIDLQRLYNSWALLETEGPEIITNPVIESYWIPELRLQRPSSSQESDSG